MKKQGTREHLKRCETREVPYICRCTRYLICNSVLVIPYMAKLSRGRTFAVFVIILPAMNVFPSNTLDAKA